MNPSSDFGLNKHQLEGIETKALPRGTYYLHIKNSRQKREDGRCSEDSFINFNEMKLKTPNSR
jgi:hypothetical protein